MSKIKITPFLIVNPLVVIWMIWVLNRLFERGGFAMIMAGLFAMIIVLVVVLLIVDIILVNRVKLRIIYPPWTVAHRTPDKIHNTDAPKLDKRELIILILIK